MTYFKKNKNLLIKYLLLLVSNILIYYFVSFYLKNITNKEIIMLFIVLIVDLIIYYYKGVVKFKYYLDLIFGILLSIILLIFIKNGYLYGINLFSIIFADNILFMISRYNKNLFKRTLQYLWILISSIIILIIGLCILIFIK